MIDFSIIIPVTRRELLDRCLQSLLEMDYSFDKFEVILILRKRYKDLPNKLNIVQIELQDINPALRRNVGAKSAKAPYLAFIDDDVTVSKDWLKNGKRILDDKESISGVGGPDFMPPKSSFSEKITDALLSHKYFGSGVLAHSYSKKKKIIKQPSAIALCNLILRKKLFDKVGFNYKVGYGGEDTELLYILQKKYDAKFLYEPSIYVFHKKRKFGLEYFKQRLKFRVNNGKMIYVYPGLYLGNKKFLLFMMGITFGIILFFINPLMFLFALFFYFLVLIFTSLSFLRKDARIFLLLPLLLFIQHIVYYIGVVIGLLHFYDYNRLRKIRRI
ncbi:MAG: glycosyltransferase [Nanoarchaeota archaeon]|nr:glycosyltransferase [Nanoarchaeota archaeon]